MLVGLLAIGMIAGSPGHAFGQQGLHIVPSPFVNNSSLNGVAAISDNDSWAVGVISGSKASNNATLAEHFDGKSWSVISTPSVAGGEFGVVGGVASNDVWAVGQQTSGSSIATLIEHWAGTSWSLFATPSSGKGPPWRRSLRSCRTMSGPRGPSITSRRS
jgi:hypothetical protein